MGKFSCTASRNYGCVSKSGAQHAGAMDPLRRLNRGILGLKFRRRHVLHGFIVDFCCLSERIVIELEGDVHDNEAQRDRRLVPLS